MRRLVGTIVLLAAVVGVPPPSGAADGSATCPELTDSVSRLYSAYFLRPPEVDGFDFWVREYSGGERSLPEISAFFAVSPEFVQRYGQLDNGAFVALVYQNVLGRSPDVGGLAYWTGLLDSGQFDRGTVMLSFSESPEFVSRTGTVTSLAGEFLWYPHGVTWECGNGSQTVAVAKAPGPSYVDVIGFNFDRSRSDAFVVWTLGPNRELNSVVLNTTVPAGSFHYLFNVVTDNESSAFHDTAFVDVRAAGTTMRWAVVFYQAPIGGARPGWQGG